MAGIPVYDDGVRGAIELAVGFQAENGMAARLGVKYDGIGSSDSLEAWNVNGWLNFRF